MVMDEDKMKRRSINVLWPEMLFVTMALNDFIWMHLNSIRIGRSEIILIKNQ